MSYHLLRVLLLGESSAYPKQRWLIINEYEYSIRIVFEKLNMAYLIPLLIFSRNKWVNKCIARHDCMSHNQHPLRYVYSIWCITERAVRGHAGFMANCPGVGVTKAPFVNFSGSEIFDLAKIPLRLFLSQIYLTGATAAELRRHLTNINVIFHG